MKFLIKVVLLIFLIKHAQGRPTDKSLVDHPLEINHQKGTQIISDLKNEDYFITPAQNNYEMDASKMHENSNPAQKLHRLYPPTTTNPISSTTVFSTQTTESTTLSYSSTQLPSTTVQVFTTEPSHTTQATCTYPPTPIPSASTIPSSSTATSTSKTDIVTTEKPTTIQPAGILTSPIPQTIPLWPIVIPTNMTITDESNKSEIKQSNLIHQPSYISVIKIDSVPIQVINYQAHDTSDKYLKLTHFKILKNLAKALKTAIHKFSKLKSGLVLIKGLQAKMKRNKKLAITAVAAPIIAGTLVSLKKKELKKLDHLLLEITPTHAFPKRRYNPTSKNSRYTSLSKASDVNLIRYSRRY